MHVFLKNGEGKLEVILVNSKSGEEVSKDTYDSIFYATGRRADTSGIGLETVGIKVRPSRSMEGHWWGGIGGCTIMADLLGGS